MNYYPQIKSLVDKIDELLNVPDITTSSKMFINWQIRAEYFLSQRYGQQSVQLKRFQSLEFEPRYEFEPEDCIRKCKDGLQKSKELFVIYMNEIEHENRDKATDSIREKLKFSQRSIFPTDTKSKGGHMKNQLIKKKYQVFVSSTYEDLKEERAAVTQCLLDNNCIPVGMEQFPSSNMSQMEYIKKMLDDCDYYILIIGGRYGTPDEDGIGYTEKEYDYAIKNGIPVMAFIFDQPEKLPFNKCEQTDSTREKFSIFRSKVLNSKKLAKFYSNIDDLKANVITAINAAIRDYPAIGWVRGKMLDENVDSGIEISNMRKEIEDLKKHTPKILTGTSDPPENLEEGTIYLQYE